MVLGSEQPFFAPCLASDKCLSDLSCGVGSFSQ